MNLKKRFLPVTIFIFLTGGVFGQMAILSGPEKGSYSRFVNDIISLVGANNGIIIQNKSTGGSAHNFKVLTNPSSDDRIALIQSDYLNLMKAQDKLNNTNKTGSLRVLMELASEEIHLVAKKSSGLKKLQDLDKKKVGIGNEDQGSSATGTMLEKRSKVNWYIYNVGFDQLLKKLSDGSIDAGLIVGSAPVSLLEIDPQVMMDGIVLLELDDLGGLSQYYENDTVHAGEYKWLDKDVPTFSVRTLLVVNDAKLSDADKQTVVAIKSGIVKNLDRLRSTGHPKWKTVIVPDDMDVPVEIASAEARAPEPVASAGKDDVKYRVQIYSRSYQRNDPVIINAKTYVPYVYSYKGAYRYTIGEFTSVAAAAELQKTCRESGYPEAFVAAFKNNKRSTDPTLFK